MAKGPKSRKERHLGIRIPEEELRVIQQKAKAAGLSVSQFIRHVCLKADAEIGVTVSGQD